jgi:hypothetical protein
MLEGKEMSSRALARCAGLFYALNFVLGIAGLVLTQQGRIAAAEQATVSAAVEYAIVVLLLACLFEPVGNRQSWGVAAIGLIGCAASAVGPLDLFVSPVNALAIFGIYCIGLGALVVRSAMMPRVIGWLLMIGGLSWLTYAWPALAKAVGPWNMALGAVAELIFTLWLLVFAVRVDEQKETVAELAA